jgi:cytochrome c oxidase assembly protein subunit 11
MSKPIKKTVFIISLLAIFMFGFSFALSPLYNVFCKKTKFNNNVRIILPETVGISASKQVKRQIRIQFITINNNNFAWDFYPFSSQITVHPGEIIKVLFFAKNNTKKTMTVQAIPNYSPVDAVKYFHKIECFCFTQQTLKSGEAVNMPVLFQIDKNLPLDIHTITLAYTLFDVTAREPK